MINRQLQSIFILLTKLKKIKKYLFYQFYYMSFINSLKKIRLGAIDSTDEINNSINKFRLFDNNDRAEEFYFYRIKQCQENGQKYVYFKESLESETGYRIRSGTPGNNTYKYIGEPSSIQFYPNDQTNDGHFQNVRFEGCDERNQVDINDTNNNLSFPLEINIKRRSGDVRGFLMYDYRTKGYSIYAQQFENLYMELPEPIYSGNLNVFNLNTYYNDNIDFTFEKAGDNRIDKILIRRGLIVGGTLLDDNENIRTLSTPDTDNNTDIGEIRYVRVPDNNFRHQKELKISQPQQFYYEFYRHFFSEVPDNELSVESVERKIGSKWDISFPNLSDDDTGTWTDLDDVGGISRYIMVSFAKNALFYSENTLKIKKREVIKIKNNLTNAYKNFCRLRVPIDDNGKIDLVRLAQSRSGETIPTMEDIEKILQPILNKDMRPFRNNCLRRTKINEMNNFGQVRDGAYWDGSKLPEKLESKYSLLHFVEDYCKDGSKRKNNCNGENYEYVTWDRGCMDKSKTQDTCTGGSLVWKTMTDGRRKRRNHNRNKLDLEVWIDELISTNSPYFEEYNNTKKAFDEYEKQLRILPFKEKTNGTAEGKSSSFSINNDPKNIRQALRETSLYYKHKDDFFRFFTNKESVGSEVDRVLVNNLHGFTIGVIFNALLPSARIYEGILSEPVLASNIDSTGIYSCRYHDDGTRRLYKIYWESDYSNFVGIPVDERGRRVENYVVEIKLVRGRQGVITPFDHLINFDGSMNSIEYFFYFVGLMLGNLIVRYWGGGGVSRYVTSLVPLGKFLNYLILNWNRRNDIDVEEMFHYVLLDNPGSDIRQIKAALGYNIWYILSENLYAAANAYLDETRLNIGELIEFSDPISEENYIDIVNLLPAINNKILLIDFILLTFYSQDSEKFDECKLFYDKFFLGISHFVKSDTKSLIQPLTLENAVFNCNLVKDKEIFLRKLREVPIIGPFEDKKTQAKNAFIEVVENMEISDFRDLISFFTALDCLPSAIIIIMMSFPHRALEGHTCFNKLDIPFRGKGLNDTYLDTTIQFYDTTEKMNRIVNLTLDMFRASR